MALRGREPVGQPVMNRALYCGYAAAVLCIAVGLASPPPASAITAELAKKCQRLAAKAYPPVLAGMKKGNAANERAYFKECLSKDGNMPEPEPQPAAPAKPQKPAPKANQ